MKKMIRTLQSDDFPVLAKLAGDIWREAYGSLLSIDQISYMLERFQSVRAFQQQTCDGYIYRGAFIDGELVGYTASVLEDKRVLLSKLYLKKAHRGAGLGRQLLEDVFELYPDISSFYLTVNKRNPAYELYLKWGFKVIDSVVSDIGNDYVMDDYIMQLDR